VTRAHFADALMFAVPMLVFAAVWAWGREVPRRDATSPPGPIQTGNRGLFTPARALVALAAAAAIGRLLVDPSSAGRAIAFVAPFVIFVGAWYVLVWWLQRGHEGPEQEAPPEVATTSTGFLRSRWLPIVLVVVLTFVSQQLLK
jgi:hypothetical protein